MKSLINFFKGMAIMVSTMVPGVSGGTMAIVLGVYDNLIHSIGSFFEDWKKNSKFLMQLGLGAGVGLLLFSNLIENALNSYPIIMRFLFIGVIIGGIPILYRRSMAVDKKKSNFIYLIIGLAIALLMSQDTSTVTTMASVGGVKGFIFLFLAGIIIAIALILPGISGSYVLLIFGLYDTVLNAINTTNISLLIPLGLGAVIGTLATTKAIEKLLNKYPGKTYMMILGFVIGSIPPIYPGLPKEGNVLFPILALIIGFAFIMWLSTLEKDELVEVNS